MRVAELSIFLFDLGKAILPSRPQFDCAAVSSGGQGWPPLGGHPKGLSLTVASTVAGFVTRGRTRSSLHKPSKTVLSASSESVILLIITIGESADSGQIRIGLPGHIADPADRGEVETRVCPVQRMIVAARHQQAHREATGAGTFGQTPAQHGFAGVPGNKDLLPNCCIGRDAERPARPW